MLRLCEMMVKYDFTDSVSIYQVHGPAKLHAGVVETHRPVDGTLAGNVVLNCKIEILFKITLFL